MSINSLASALVLLLALAIPQTADRIQARTPAPVTIPFELVNHLVILKGRINNSRPLSFVLDTGANAAIVRMDVAKELELSLFGTVNAGGAGPARQTGSRVRNATWSLAGLDGFAQPVSLTLPLTELPAALGRDLDAIIGGEFIKQFVVELDYQAHTIRLHDPATFVYRGQGQTLPLDLNRNGHPVVKATVIPSPGVELEGQFLLDIGSALPLALHSPFVASHNLPASESKTIRAIGAAGVGGSSPGRFGRVTAITIGSFTIKAPITLFSQDTAGAFADATLAGNIGGQIGNRFHIFLDYGRRQIILEPSSEYAQPYDRAFSGFTLRAEGPEYRTLRVREVLEDSPASEAGIVAGDIITSVDGIAAGTLTMTAVNEMLEQPASRDVVIRRGDQIIRTRLTPRALF